MFVAMLLVSDRTNFMGDFAAFYCAGDAIAHGANPYLEEPLHTCEQRTRAAGGRNVLRDVTVPAPLPPAALIAFVPLSRLPFPWAAALVEIGLFGAMIASVVLYERTIGVSSVVLNLAFAGVTATQTFALGQPVPFVFLAVAGAAWFARRGAWIAASACAAGTILEPAIAVPVFLAMFVMLPRTRLPLAVFGIALVLASIGAVGVAATVAYVRDVIPAHALSNAYEWQFSLTSILTSLGSSARSAVWWGEVMYAVMTIGGVAVAYRLWRTTGDGAVVVLLPPAFAVFGGVHVHYQQLIVAFPAILYVWARFPRERYRAATGVAFAMVPWNVLCASALIAFAPLLTGWFGRTTMDARRGLVLAASAAAIEFAVIALALGGFGPGDTHFVAQAYPPGALAEASWGHFSQAMLARTSLLMQFLRVPVLAGLALGLIAVSRAAFA